MPTSLEHINSVPDASIVKFLQDNGFEIRDPLVNKLIAIGVLYTYGYIIESDWRYIIDDRFNELMLMNDQQLDNIVKYLPPGLFFYYRLAKVRYIIDHFHPDWRKVAVSVSDGKYDYWEIPVGTILYHGTSYKFPDNALPRTPAFYGALETSAFYAFRGDHHRGENGKIITSLVVKPIKILDINERNLSGLSLLDGYDKDLFTSVFTDTSGIHRSSYGSSDQIIFKWLCSKGFEGVGYPKIKGFHDEVIICSDNDNLVRFNIEYRFVREASDCVFKIQEDNITPISVMDINNVYFNYVPEIGTNKTDAHIKYLMENGEKLCKPSVNISLMKAIRENNINAIRIAYRKDYDLNDYMDDFIKYSSVDMIKEAIKYGLNKRIMREKISLLQDDTKKELLNKIY